ncbi:hypothetical protein GCM10022255_097210 [Dactylosporangium darangshiense]|uniref:Uncharacterized protein n=1 Tax=Dactylosporangium darangshiense TaxID=579108 RepID=A0ABP8DR04_9ACTN
MHQRELALRVLLDAAGEDEHPALAGHVLQRAVQRRGERVRQAAAAEGVKLTVAAGKADGDEAGQVQAIEDAIARGDAGILITPNGLGVNPATRSPS